MPYGQPIDGKGKQITGRESTTMKRIAIGIFLTIQSTLCLSQSDSLKLIPVPKYKLEKLLHAYFYIQPACDSTVTKLSTVLDSLKFALQASQAVTKVITLERDNKAAEAQSLSDKAKNQAVMYKAELKAEKHKGLKTGFLAGAGLGLLLILLL